MTQLLASVMDALNRALVRFQPFIAWFQRVTHGWNWYRLAFLFIPAFIRGDLKFFSFYLPFIFGKGRGGGEERRGGGEERRGGEEGERRRGGGEGEGEETGKG